ncbi:MAG: NADH-ubiquinone oxidoreductase-F iron-sulfur binding region domain-containing protein [Beijerinckiaceae bacterium]|nr:NADH-ubiquinone oxidoreductase-F iron-sulfur binding region domain-containing protein [Beijerinckiaceae bacterium]
MNVRFYIPADAAAKSVGADAVAAAVHDEAMRRGLAVEIIRTGSRGLLWLEPMVEIETTRGRVAYGNVRAGDVTSLFAAGLPDGADHPLSLGPVKDIVYLRAQTRLTFARVGVNDPLSFDAYVASGGMIGLTHAQAIGADAILEEMTASGLRGRGGAGFPAAIKWRTVRDAQSSRKYIVVNADEGDSGTFADRMLMEGDPFLIIEGMAISALAVGAHRGVIYIRSEYPHAIQVLNEALRIARREKLLGAHFDIEVRVGAGAYVCGEETALLESIEGKRGQVRAKPPLPAHRGLFGRPTLVHNVLTIAAAPTILSEGGKAYGDLGVGRSRGTKPVQLAGNVKRGGLFELPFGVTLRELVFDIGGGTASGRPLRAVQVGGPLGAYFPEHLLDTPLDYEAMAKAGGLLGHGGIVVFDDSVDMARQARFAFEFCATESCGKCTPCRIGSTRGAETIDKIVAGVEVEKNMALVDDLLNVMTDASLCALGGLTPLPVGSAMKHFPEDFIRAPKRAAAE